MRQQVFALKTQPRSQQAARSRFLRALVPAHSWERLINACPRIRCYVLSHRAFRSAASKCSTMYGDPGRTTTLARTLLEDVCK